jgi:hypothetical protein
LLQPVLRGQLRDRRGLPDPAGPDEQHDLLAVIRGDPFDLTEGAAGCAPRFNATWKLRSNDGSADPCIPVKTSPCAGRFSPMASAWSASSSSTAAMTSSAELPSMPNAFPHFRTRLVERITASAPSSCLIAVIASCIEAA